MVVSNKNFELLVASRISQDAAEKVLSRIRSKSVSHPQPSKFKTTLKLVYLLNTKLMNVYERWIFSKNQPSKVDEHLFREENYAIVTTSEAVKFLSCVSKIVL